MRLETPTAKARRDWTRFIGLLTSGGSECRACYRMPLTPAIQQRYFLHGIFGSRADACARAFAVRPQQLRWPEPHRSQRRAAMVDESYFGPEGVTDDDRRYAGSLYSDVRSAI